jgi:hypothetical protein
LRLCVWSQVLHINLTILVIFKGTVQWY